MSAGNVTCQRWPSRSRSPELRAAEQSFIICEWKFPQWIIPIPTLVFCSHVQLYVIIVVIIIIVIIHDTPHHKKRVNLTNLLHNHKKWAMEHLHKAYIKLNPIWLVVCNMNSMTSHSVGNVIIPTDPNPL